MQRDHHTRLAPVEHEQVLERMHGPIRLPTIHDQQGLPEQAVFVQNGPAVHHERLGRHRRKRVSREVLEALLSQLVQLDDAFSKSGYKAPTDHIRDLVENDHLPEVVDSRFERVLSGDEAGAAFSVQNIVSVVEVVSGEGLPVDGAHAELGRIDIAEAVFFEVKRVAKRVFVLVDGNGQFFEGHVLLFQNEVEVI